MSKPLTSAQVEALRSVPIGPMPNRIRVALGMVNAKQAELAEETGQKPSNVSDIVNGKYSDLQIETARKYADFFGCAIEDLFPMREDIAS